MKIKVKCELCLKEISEEELEYMVSATAWSSNGLISKYYHGNCYDNAKEKTTVKRGS